MIEEIVKVCRDCGIRPRHGNRKPYCKECRNARERKAYANTPYEIRAKKQLDRFYRNAENGKRINRENMRKRRCADPERYRKENREYFRQHPDYQREWRAKNPEKCRAAWVKRRSRVAGAEGYFTEQDWLNIVYRQQSCCMSCGLFCALTVDHICPLARGGTNWPDNIQGLCGSCNSSKSARTDYQFSVL